MVLVLVMGGMLFNSCSKDDKVKSKSLAGSVWEVKYLVYNTPATHTITFHPDITNRCIMEFTIGGLNSYIYEYTYNHPEVTFTPRDKNRLPLIGIIKGNSMSLIDLNSLKEIYVLDRIK